MSISKTESFKAKAAVIRKFLKEKYDVDVSQGHGLELISKISGYRDWNTASAALKPKVKQGISADQIETVGDMKRALEAFDDSAMIEACYEFKLKEFEIDPLADPEDEIYQEFSFTLGECAKDVISFKLRLEDESMGMNFGSSPLREECGFFEMQKSDES